MYLRPVSILNDSTRGTVVASYPQATVMLTKKGVINHLTFWQALLVPSNFLLTDVIANFIFCCFFIAMLRYCYTVTSHQWQYDSMYNKLKIVGITLLLYGITNAIRGYWFTTFVPTVYGGNYKLDFNFYSNNTNTPFIVIGYVAIIIAQRLRYKVLNNKPTNPLPLV